MKKLFEPLIEQILEIIFKTLQIYTAIFVIFTIQIPSDTQVLGISPSQADPNLFNWPDTNFM